MRSARLTKPSLISRIRFSGRGLLEYTWAVFRHSGKSAHDIFGSPDDVKFRSSMTLFDEADQGGGLYHEVLGQFFERKR
jgi:uncharacterized protein (DUF1810 family)